MKKNDYSSYSYEQLHQVLGIFDTAGPSILSYPAGAAIHSGMSEKSRLRIINSFKTHNKFVATQTIPLCYFHKKSTIMVVESDIESYLSAVTFAHEAHHFLNICSSPLGYLMHTAQTLLTIGFYGIFNNTDKSDLLKSLAYPLVDMETHILDQPLRNLLGGFLEMFVNPYLALQRCLLGKLSVDSISDEEDVEEKKFGIESLKTFYRILDTNFGSSLERYLEHINPGYPPFAVIKNYGTCELGGLQLAEHIGWSGEYFWLAYIQQFSESEDYKEKHKLLLDNCFSDNAAYALRYRVPLILENMLLGKHTRIMNSIFASWMALLTPLDLRTLHLVREYRLGWEDIHPGHRYISILNVISKKNIRLEDAPSDLRTKVPRYFDTIADALGWPKFETMLHAMATPHSLEAQLFDWSHDPFRRIYEKIAEKRKKYPWCDIYPGEELLENDPLHVPIAIIDGKISVSNQECGFDGFQLFSLARIRDLLVFGDCGPMVSLLLNDVKLKEALDILCHRHLGCSLSIIQDIMRQLERRKNG